MPYDVSQLLAKTDAELDAMFTAADPGPIPNGPAEGTAIIANGTKFSPEIAKIVSLFAWQGKTFNRESDQFATLRNRITLLGIDAIVAEVYFGPSLLDGKQCIVLDYSKTSTVAERVRDEIRLIAGNTYLGRVYWDNKPTIHFALQFTS
ncbi:MAG TPA: hypothetical protein VGR95_16025 [Thermoanaerobaculia bacterium]|jgi:hypothetical protein|nr:hypothetical protein [Thermoanaerobaculia bacterium]